jgi:hypothetical protein
MNIKLTQAIARHASESVDIVRKQRDVSRMKTKEITEATELLTIFVLSRFKLNPEDHYEAERCVRRQIRQELTEENSLTL